MHTTAAFLVIQVTLISSSTTDESINPLSNLRISLDSLGFISKHYSMLFSAHVHTFTAFPQLVGNPFILYTHGHACLYVHETSTTFLQDKLSSWIQGGTKAKEFHFVNFGSLVTFKKYTSRVHQDTLLLIFFTFVHFISTSHKRCFHSLRTSYHVFMC